MYRVPGQNVERQNVERQNQCFGSGFVFTDPDPGFFFSIRIQVKKKHLERQLKKNWGFLPVWYLFTCIFEFALQNGCQISTCMIKKHITAN
jgi:hypothetical protein